MVQFPDMLCQLTLFAPRPLVPMSQEDLHSLWLGDGLQHGRLSLWEQAKALGLREASKEIHNGRTQLEWVAARVTKVGGDTRLLVLFTISFRRLMQTRIGSQGSTLA